MIDLLGPAQRCLDFFVAHWDLYGWDLPGQRYIAAGASPEVADDTDQFVVSLTSITPGSGMRGGLPARGSGAQATPTATYAVRLVRCAYVTDDPVPDADRLHDEGRQYLTDAARILDTLIVWRSEEPLTVSLNALTEVGQLSPAGPEGGVVGHQATFVISQFADVER